MILITRPQPLAGLTASHLTELGFLVIIAPVLKIEYLNYDSYNNDKYDALIITSQNAAAVLRDRPGSRSSFIYVVGKKSRDILSGAGFKNVLSVGETASSLLNFFQENRSHVKKILYLRGDEVSIDIKKNLSGIVETIDEIVVYKSIPINSWDDQLLSKIRSHATTVLFYSRKTASCFKMLAQSSGLTLNYMTAVCISENVAATICDLQWKDILISDSPNEDCIIDLLMARNKSFSNEI